MLVKQSNMVRRVALSASPQQPVRECHPVHDHVPDTPALGEPVAVVERVVNTAIEAGEGRFLRGLLKGGERPWGLGGHQAMISEEGVGECDHAEYVREAGSSEYASGGAHSSPEVRTKGRNCPQHGSNGCGAKARASAPKDLVPLMVRRNSDRKLLIRP